jgi:glutathione S-transferase
LVPVLLSGDHVVRDSWDIAIYLGQHLPDKLALFPTEGDVRMAQFIHHWTVTQRHLYVFKTLAADIWDALNSQD